MIRCPISIRKPTSPTRRRSSGSGGSHGGTRSPSIYRPTEEERRATDGGKTVLPRMQASLSRVEPGASGFGGVPGYLLPAGMGIIMKHLRDRCRMRGKGTVFCDIGCGEGRPVLACAEASPRMAGVIGFDVDDITLNVARNNAVRFKNLSWDGTRYRKQNTALTSNVFRLVSEPKGDVPPICLLNADVEKLTDLGCVTHAYSFCNGMPPLILRHLFRVCASTPSLRYVVLVYKRQAGDEANDMVERLKRLSSTLHVFSQEGRSQLKMPGQTAHGCCVRMSGKVRLAFLEASLGVTPGAHSTTLNACFVT